MNPIASATRRIVPTVAMALAALAAPQWSLAQASNPTPAAVSRQAAELAGELFKLCPVSEPGNQAAFDACRAGLYGSASALRAALPSYVLWGRQRNEALTLKESKLTQFAPDVFSGMYLPLFMFNGKYSVEYVEREKLYLVRLQAAFRNRLAPGQFPYPFWHEAEKWSMYQNANQILLWMEPQTTKVKVAQFTVLGATPPVIAASAIPAPRPFDGRWMWTDENGRTQPMVTVFDGLLSANNPYIRQLEASYKRLALRMRDGECNKCHVPNNPDGMKRLVLLQTPAHAAGEIKRLLDSVRTDKMPVDDMGMERPLSAEVKTALLEEGRAFDALYQQAKEWEASNSRPARQ